MSKRLQEIQSYWNARSNGFSNASNEELETKAAESWREVFEKNIRPGAKVLDDGAGAGFFTVLLSDMGYEVDAIDYSQGMLEKIQEHLNRRNLKANVRQMDAQKLLFEDASFDAVVSRDVFWCLEDPGEAYREAARVLKNGGTLILKDGNYYLHLHNEKYRKAKEERLKPEDTHGHVKHNVDHVDFSIMEKIAEDLPMSKYERPQFDVGLLIESGFRDIQISVDGDELPMGFLIIATKKG